MILAAGASTRLGGGRLKQLLPFRGRSLLRHAAEVALAAGASPVVVVLGAQAERLRGELAGLPVEVVVNTGWEEGMASSLRAGLAALVAAAPDTGAVLLMLCDQPLVTPEALQALVAAHRASGKPAIASEYASGGPLGPPCLFARPLFADLLALSGAQGAKQLLSRLSPDATLRVSLPEADQDIDTAADWERFHSKKVV